MENQTETIKQLKDRCDKLERQNAELAEQNNWLKEQFRLKQQKQFGSSSEATPLLTSIETAPKMSVYSTPPNNSMPKFSFT